MRILQSEAVMGLWNLSPSPFHSAPSAREGKDLIKEAYRAGIRTFDTAFSYGEADSLLSAAMRELGTHDFSVVSKVMPVPTLKKKAMISLRRLGIERFSVLLLHWPSDDDAIMRSMEDLLALREEGLTEAIGVSNFPLPLLRKTASRFPIGYHERPLSLIWNRDWEEEKAFGIRTLAYAPLGMGLLSGRYSTAAEIPDERKNLKAVSSPAFPELLRELSGDASIALSWVYSNHPWGVVSGFSRRGDTALLGSVHEIGKEKMARLTALADEITACSEADNIFAHRWR